MASCEEVLPVTGKPSSLPLCYDVIEFKGGKEGIPPPLCSLLGTSYFPEVDISKFLEIYSQISEKYPQVEMVFRKLVGCGHGSVTVQNKRKGRIEVIPLYCDNRICQKPECKRHREYKYRKQHRYQIRHMKRSIHRPKSYVFSIERLPYPVDKRFVAEMRRKLARLLDCKKHPEYGSVTDCSIHTEIKPGETSYYLHFHVVSGFIRGLKQIRGEWGYQIMSQPARCIGNLERYVSKYASKVPEFHLLAVDMVTRLVIVMQYFEAVYKAQMHTYLVDVKAPGRVRGNFVFILVGGADVVIPGHNEIVRSLACYYAFPPGIG